MKFYEILNTACTKMELSYIIESFSKSDQPEELQPEELSFAEQLNNLY